MVARRIVPTLISLALGLAGLAPAIARAADPAPISLHPDNPKYFLFRGKPLVLITATEHYGSVLNRPFDYRKYLDDAADKKQTLTRTFLLFRELASASNPKSPCKPEPQDYIAPWPRTGTAMALDGQPQFDLDAWNEEYFKRLHDFLALASERGIVVELTLLSNSYFDGVWALNPLRAENNKQGVGKIEWPEYTSLKDPAVNERQFAHARKIVRETAKYDNVYYEICNEPGGGVAGHVTPAEVDAWQIEIAKVVREELAKLKKTHMVFASEAFSYTPVFTQGLDASFAADGVGAIMDVVNVHPLPNTVLDGRPYQLGNFMSKELRLHDLRDFGLAAWRKPKANVWDEDNAATMFRDEVGWTIHRKRAWVALLSGAHYDMIDFSIQAGGLESGTPESNKAIRTWFKHLSAFIHSVDFLHASPLPTWVGRAPDHVLASTFCVEGKDYVAYLADAREVTDPHAGEPIEGTVEVALPPGTYGLRFFSPTEGTYGEETPLTGGRTVTVDLPPFRHDVVLRAVRKS
jgi:hypothetical protein